MSPTGAGVGVALIVCLALPACGGGDGEEAETTTGASETTEAGPARLESEAVDLDLPRSVVYANLEITIRSVTVSNATPGTYLEDEPAPGDDSYAYVETTIEHELTDPGDRVDVEVFALELADGSAVDGEEVDFSSTVTIDPGVASELTVAFPVEGADDLDGAVLVVEESGRVPARLPLDGAVDDDPYPVSVPVSGSGTVSYEGGCNNATGTFEVTGAEVDLDAGADHADKALEPNESKRAKVDERWLRVTVRVIAQSGTCGGTIANDDAFRLFVDDLPTAPLNRDNELLENGAGTEFIWGWTVPVDAELVLQGGVADGTTVDVPFELPSDLP